MCSKVSSSHKIPAVIPALLTKTSILLKCFIAVCIVSLTAIGFVTSQDRHSRRWGGYLSN